MDLGQGRAERTATSFALGGGSSLTVRSVNWNDVMLGLWKGTFCCVLVESGPECVGTLIYIWSSRVHRVRVGRQVGSACPYNNSDNGMA